MQKKNEELKNEEAKVRAKLNMYLENLKEWENTVSIQQEEAARNAGVNACLIQKKVEALQADDNDIVQQNTKAFAAHGDVQQNQLSPPTPLLVQSTANGNGNGTDK